MTTSGNRKVFSRKLGWAMCSVLLLSNVATAQEPGDWSMYRGDLVGTGYSALTQIDASNVDQLKQAWRYSLRAAQDNATNPNSQATPIVINDVMYLPAADRVIAPGISTS